MPFLPVRTRADSSDMTTEGPLKGSSGARSPYAVAVSLGENVNLSGGPTTGALATQSTLPSGSSTTSPTTGSSRIGLGMVGGGFVGPFGIDGLDGLSQGPASPAFNPTDAYAGGDAYDSGGGGGRGGGGGGAGGGGPTSTAVGLRAGYLYSRSLVFNFNANYSFPTVSDPNNPTGNLSSLSVAGGLSFVPADQVTVDTNIQYRNSSSDTTNPSLSFPSQLAGPDQGFGSTDTSINARGRYFFDRTLDIFLTEGVSFNRGLLDPVLGVTNRWPAPRRRAGETLAGFVSLSASAPLSTISQNLSKITTLAAQGGPVYRNGAFSARAIVSAAYSLYSGPANPTGLAAFQNGSQFPQNSGTQTQGGSQNPFATSTDPNAPSTGTSTYARPVFQTSTNGSLGYKFAKEWGASTGAGLQTSYNEDGTTNFFSNATLLNVNYRPSAFTASASVSFISDPSQSSSFSIPTQPFIGLRLEYTFGESGALRRSLMPTF